MSGVPPSVRPSAGGRHESRERAIHLLYEVEMKQRSTDDVLADQVVGADPYATDLVVGVGSHLAEIDTLVASLARGWTLERMPTLDLVVLRIACFELAHRPDVPTGVIISEAVDFAGRYGTDESSKFVNGVLASAARELRPEVD